MVLNLPSVRTVLKVWVVALSPVVGMAADYMSPGMSPEEVYARLQTEQAPLVVDVRKPFEYKIGHIPGAINIPVEELEVRLEEVKPDNGVLIY